MVGEIWKTKDGREIPVEEMNVAHIKNCISMIISWIKENGFNTEEWNDWIIILMKELTKRRFIMKNLENAIYKLLKKGQKTKKELFNHFKGIDPSTITGCLRTLLDKELIDKVIRDSQIYFAYKLTGYEEILDIPEEM